MTTTVADLRSQVLQYAKDKMGTKVGSGECFDLADFALKDAGAKTASDFGTVTPTADYVWGTEVALAKAKAGDILQYRDYKRSITVETKVTFPDGAWFSYSESQSIDRPHHTAVVASAPVNSKLEVLEQNVARGASATLVKTVGDGEIHIKSVPGTTKKVRIQVNSSWKTKMKKIFAGNREMLKLVDDLAKKFAGRSVDGEEKTTVTVSGTVKAYSPVSK